MDFAMLQQVKELAEALSKDEILDYLGLDFAKLPSEDQQRIDAAIRQGRHEIKLFAARKLKDAMSQKDGGRLALNTLIRFADDWESEVGEGGDGLQGRKLVISFDGD